MAPKIAANAIAKLGIPAALGADADNTWMEAVKVDSQQVPPSFSCCFAVDNINFSSRRMLTSSVRHLVLKLRKSQSGKTKILLKSVN